MRLRGFITLLAAIAYALPASAQSVPTPEEHFGFAIGSDRKLADWDALTAYFERLAQTSDRVQVDTLGPTTAGRPFVMLTITSPENHARLEELREIQRKLADPRLIADASELGRLLDTGRAVVLITQGIHATEVGASQMSANLAWELATSTSVWRSSPREKIAMRSFPRAMSSGAESPWRSAVAKPSKRNPCMGIDCATS